MTYEPVPGSKLERYSRSALVRGGACGALLDEEAQCERPPGHLAGDLPHLTHGPYGHRRVEFDDDRRILSDTLTRKAPA